MRLVALTHNLEPAFFDDDLLPNVLGLSRTDDRSYAAGIELQRKLQGISSRVLMAASAYRGRPSLRTEVHPLSLGGSGRLHAKYFVAEHERAVLMSIGSANLTSNGFRKNREVAGVMVTTEETLDDAATMLQTVAGAIRTLERLDQAWTPAVLSDLEAVRDKIVGWHSSTTESRHRIVWSDGEHRLLDVLVGAWNGAPIGRISIVSPFWSEDGQQPSPLRELLERLRAAGCLADSVEVHLYFDAHALEGGDYNPAYPSRFRVRHEDLSGIKVVAHAIDPRVDKSELDVKVDIYDARPLHAKVLLLEGARQGLAYAGSANFTRNGFGIGRSANIEAGWLLQGSSEELSGLIPPTIGNPAPIQSGAVTAEVPKLEEEAVPYFPDFLSEVSLKVDPQRLDQLELSVRWSKSAPKRFEIRTLRFSDSAAAGAGDMLLLGKGGKAGEALVSLAPESVRQLLQAREVWVQNQDQNLAGAYPVNVAPEARLLLPLAPGAARPGEEALLAYYQGQISFEELYPDPEDSLETGPRSLDGLERSGVDTTRIQSYRIRAFVEALPGMLSELSRVCGPQPLLEMAFLGETSPVGLARCIVTEVSTGMKSPTAAGFQLVEILRVLREAAAHVGQRDPKLLRDVAERAERQISALLETLQTDRPETFEPGGAFGRYQQAILGGRSA